MLMSDGKPLSGQLLRELRKLAEQAARTGGAVARRAFGATLRTRRKPDGSEVTNADEAAQQAIVRCLHAARPGDDLIAEEGLRHMQRLRKRHAAGADSPICWVVDPLDGTRNFIAGIPLYAVSVAALCAGVPVAGAVYLPERDQMYSSAGDGIYRNGRRFTPRSRRALRRWLVGIPSFLNERELALVRSWPRRVVLRNLGVTSLHLAMVAAGQLEATLITDSRLWDIAAGWLLVCQAGGVMTRLDGRGIFPADLERYAGEPIPSLASRSVATHQKLLGAYGSA